MKKENLSKIFESLGFLVFDNREPTFDLYLKDTPRGIDWFGDFSVSGKYYMTKGKQFDKPEELIGYIKEENKKLPCPSFCYDPNCVPSFGVESAFIWYLRGLGFKLANDGYNHMILVNLYGEDITSVYLDLEDGVRGKVIRTIKGKFSWISSEFNGIQEMIGSVNSILGPELLLVATQTLKASLGMSSDRAGDITANVLSTSNSTIYRANMKKTLKDALKQAYEEL